MEIRTTKKAREDEGSEVSAGQAKSMYLRRKTEFRKSSPVSRTLTRAFKVAGRLGVLALFVSFLASVLYYAFTSEEFSLQTVRLLGCTHLDTARVEEIIRKEFPSRLLQIDLKKLRSRLEAETWCRRAEIRRVLPSELDIYVQERTPAAILEIQGELMLADEEGILLDKYDARYGKMDVPVFKGVLGDNAMNYRQSQEENSERVRMGLGLLAELESDSPELTSTLSEVDLSDKSNVRLMRVDDTAEIYIGDRNFLKRYKTFLANANRYREIKEQYGEVMSVDLRFDGQIIYRPRKPPATQPVTTAEARK